MKASTHDKMHGTSHQLKGAIKEKTGLAIGNPGLEKRGHDEKIDGKAQKKMGDIEKVLEK
jgi:uncharacterized protein YjbJ (UPF0337 family)